jgi:hypothetical protein
MTWSNLRGALAEHSAKSWRSWVQIVEAPSFSEPGGDPYIIRARPGISCSIEGGEAPPWEGARRAHTRRYVTDERHSYGGWIVVVNEHVIPGRALKKEGSGEAGL